MAMTPPALAKSDGALKHRHQASAASKHLTDRPITPAAPREEMPQPGWSGPYGGLNAGSNAPIER
jgi:hypothetical protein